MDAPTTTSRRPGRPAGRQGADLLDTARTVFLEHGFAGTTMHDVASRAGISKASLYREHDSKDELFAAVVTDWAAHGRGAMRPVVERLLTAQDLHAALVELAGTIQAAVLAADVVQMRRLVTAESERFPASPPTTSLPAGTATSPRSPDHRRARRPWCPPHRRPAHRRPPVHVDRSRRRPQRPHDRRPGRRDITAPTRPLRRRSRQHAHRGGLNDDRRPSGEGL